MVQDGTILPAVTLSVAELARMLGLHPKTILAAARRREIPSRRVGRRLLFSRAAIEAWLAGEPPHAPENASRDGASTRPAGHSPARPSKAGKSSRRAKHPHRQR
jgi:excisionase family DNA binding protein